MSEEDAPRAPTHDSYLWKRGYYAGLEGRPAGQTMSEKLGHAAGSRIAHLTDGDGNLPDPHAAFAVLLGGSDFLAEELLAMFPAAVWGPYKDGRVTAYAKGDEIDLSTQRVTYHADSGRTLTLSYEAACASVDRSKVEAKWGTFREDRRSLASPGVTPRWIRNHVQTAPLVRHVERGTVYRLQEIVTLQMSGTEHDGRELVLYRDVKHGVPWVRPIEDFESRFEVAGPDVGWAVAGNVWHAATRPAGSQGAVWTLCSRGVIEGTRDLGPIPEGRTLPRCPTCERTLAKLTGGDQ